LKTVWHILLVALLSALKFQLAFPLAKTSGLNFWETILATVIGGISGVFFFVFLSEKLVIFFRRFQSAKNSMQGNHSSAPQKKKFSRYSRFLVRFSRRFGLLGLAFITPSILSIPLGTFISSRLNDKFVRNKPRLIIYLIASVLFWSFAFSGLVEIF
jgi:hypothetical protein